MVYDRSHGEVFVMDFELRFELWWGGINLQEVFSSMSIY